MIKIHQCYPTSRAGDCQYRSDSSTVCSTDPELLIFVSVPLAQHQNNIVSTSGVRWEKPCIINKKMLPLIYTYLCCRASDSVYPSIGEDVCSKQS